MKSSSANQYIAEECGQAQDVLLDRFELAALPHNASAARERIRQVCEKLGFHNLEAGEIEVAFGEAINNAILYGSPHPGSQIAISCCLRRIPTPGPPALIIQVRDQGKGFDPASLPKGEVGSDALGGRGIGLIRALMDAVVLYHDGTGMVVRMARLAPNANQAQ